MSEFLRELLRHGEMGRKGEVRDYKEVYRDFNFNDIKHVVRIVILF